MTAAGRGRSLPGGADGDPAPDGSPADGAARWPRRLRALADRDYVRAPFLLLYYLALIYVLIRLYGGPRPPAPVPFIYQGF